MQQKVCPQRGMFFIVNRQELLGFFLQTRKIKKLLCNNCNNCYNCKRFEFIKEELNKNAFFLRDIAPKKEPSPKQPILWRRSFQQRRLKKKTNLILKFIYIKNLNQIF